MSRRNRSMELRNGDAPYKMAPDRCQVQVQAMDPEGNVWLWVQCKRKATHGEMCEEHHASHAATWGSVTKER